MATVESGSQSAQQALEDCSGKEVIQHGIFGDLPLAVETPKFLKHVKLNHILVRRANLSY